MTHKVEYVHFHGQSVSGGSFSDFKNRFLDIDVDTIPVQGKSSSRYFKINTQLVPTSKDANDKGIINISFGSDVDGAVQSATAVQLDLDSSIDALTLKKTNALKYNITLQGANTSIKDNVNGEINTVSWSNNKLKTKNWNTMFTINADLPSFKVNDLSIGLNLTGEDKLELEPFTLPQVQTANTIDLNKATDAELNKVENEIMASFGTFYFTNKPIIDAVTGN